MTIEERLDNLEKRNKRLMVALTMIVDRSPGYSYNENQYMPK